MKRMAPLPLIAIAVLYVASKAWFLLFQFKLAGLLRIVLYSFVLLFAIRGSEAAAKLWGALSVLGAVVTAYGAVKIASSSVGGASFLAGYALFFAGSAAYVFFSRGLSQFYRQQHAEPST